MHSNDLQAYSYWMSGIGKKKRSKPLWLLLALTAVLESDSYDSKPGLYLLSGSGIKTNRCRGDVQMRNRTVEAWESFLSSIFCRYDYRVCAHIPSPSEYPALILPGSYVFPIIVYFEAATAHK